MLPNPLAEAKQPAPMKIGGKVYCYEFALMQIRALSFTPDKIGTGCHIHVTDMFEPAKREILGAYIIICMDR